MPDRDTNENNDYEAVARREMAEERFAQDLHEGKYNHLFPNRAKRLAAKKKQQRSSAKPRSDSI